MLALSMYRFREPRPLYTLGVPIRPKQLNAPIHCRLAVRHIVGAATGDLVINEQYDRLA